MKWATLIAMGLLLATVRSQVVKLPIQNGHGNTKAAYFATVEIGNPSQNLTLQIDTGSSDTWVIWSGAEKCADSDYFKSDNCAWGSFSFEKSDTFSDVGPGQFQITYMDGDESSGDYFEDDIKIGGAVIHNLTMGLGMDTSCPYGIIGLGYVTREASGEMYPNLPVGMEQAGLINTVAYSLWLNDLGARSGSLLFGGIDTSKFVGELTRIEILPYEVANKPNEFVVALTSVEAMSPSGHDSLAPEQFPIHAVLDTGATITLLPDDLAGQIWTKVGAVHMYVEEVRGSLAVLPCHFANHPGHFSFGFAGSRGPRINITMDELVLGIGDSPPLFESGPYRGEFVCMFGVQAAEGDTPILGDTFLRSAYVVYDLVNNEIGLAATDFNSTESNIVAFESYGATVPSATAVPRQDDDFDLATSVQTGLSAANGLQNRLNSSGASKRSYGYCAVVGSLATLFMFLKCPSSVV